MVRPTLLRSAHQEFEAVVGEATAIEAATFYYPGWTVQLDGHEVPVEPVPERGTMLFHAQADTHRVSLVFRETPLRHNAALLSVVTATVLALSLGWRRLQKRIACSNRSDALWR